MNTVNPESEAFALAACYRLLLGLARRKPLDSEPLSIADDIAPPQPHPNAIPAIETAPEPQLEPPESGPK